MSTPVILLGKRDCTKLEIDALHTLGYGLALIGSQLHTTPTPGAPAAVLDGYTVAGGKAMIHRSGMGQVDGEVIVILDTALERKLNERLPGWRQRDNWQVLDNERMVVDWVSAFVTLISLDGHDLSEGVAA